MSRHILTNDIQFRYGIFELEYSTTDGRIESKIVLILYAPDIAPAKEKFIYATSKDEVKKKLQPFNKEIQVNDWADLNDEQFVKYFKH
jgi:Cofilin/tropomyosin-type actin-binding protein